MRVSPHARGHRLLPRVLIDRGFYALTVPKNEYYVLTKASTFYPNYKLHPNTGTPLYNIKHEFSDLVSKAHDLLDGLGDDDHTQYSLANGTRAFSAVVSGVSPTANAHLTTKEYVDIAVSGLKIDFFYTDTDSDITNYYVMQDSQTGEAESDITSAALSAGDNQLIFSFASAASLPFNNLQVGIYDGHFHLEKLAGAAKTVTIYWKLFHRDTGGTETELFQGETSGAVTSVAPFELHAVLATARAFISTDRLVVKVYANVAGGGATAQVKLYMEGTTNSHMRAALETETLSDIFLRQDGTKALAGAWDMGNQVLTNVNIDSGDINTAVTNSEWDAAYSHIHNLTSDIDHDQLTNVHPDMNTTASPTFAGLTIDGPGGSGLTLYEDASNQGYLEWNKVNDRLEIHSTGVIDLYAHGDLSDYWEFGTIGDIPTITCRGADGRIEHLLDPVSAQDVSTKAYTDARVSNAAFAATWDAVTTIAPSKNAVYDRLHNYIHLRDEKAQNTSGGDFTAGAWRTRVLNTEVTDEPDACSLDSNQFTLAAGTYRIHASAPAWDVNNHQTRLYNITDAAVELKGSNATASQAYDGGAHSFVVGLFTIAAQKTFELQHRCNTTKTLRGFGSETNYPDTTCIYTEVELWKVA